VLDDDEGRAQQRASWRLYPVGRHPVSSSSRSKGEGAFAADLELEQI
jgi:hypothetical protein